MFFPLSQTNENIKTKRNHRNTRSLVKSSTNNFKSNKENLETQRGRCSWVQKSMEKSVQCSNDSLFVQSDAEDPKIFNESNFQFRNFFRTHFSMQSKSKRNLSQSSGKNTLFDEQLSKKTPEEYIENTHSFIRNCLQSIIPSSNNDLEPEKKSEKCVQIDQKKPELPDILFLLNQYNRKVARRRRPISKKKRKKRFQETATSFLSKHPRDKKSLFLFFRQSVETLPLLLNIFRPEQSPKLQRIQDQISINHLKNYPKRSYQEKALKSSTQLLCFKYYFLKMKRRPELRDKSIGKLQALTHNSRRQIYKWIWDEEKRFNEVNENCSEKEKLQREQVLLDSWKKFKGRFKREVRQKKLWIMDRVVVGCNDFFSKGVLRKVWGIKLKGLLQKSVFLDFEGKFGLRN